MSGRSAPSPASSACTTVDLVLCLQRFANHRFNSGPQSSIHTGVSSSTLRALSRRARRARAQRSRRRHLQRGSSPGRGAPAAAVHLVRPDPLAEQARQAKQVAERRRAKAVFGFTARPEASLSVYALHAPSGRVFARGVSLARQRDPTARAAGDRPVAAVRRYSTARLTLSHC